jgi:hypothetical protein
VIGAHASANLKYIPAGSFAKSAELKDERLKLVPGLPLTLKALKHFSAVGVDLAA